MKKLLFNQTKFLTSAPSLEKCPTLARGIEHECAILGRSNVGKSSLLNHLFQAKIAKTSSTPGKTQLINFFLVDQRLCIVDLPGYGFAKVGAGMRKNWGESIEAYLTKRESLNSLLFLVDIRHSPHASDLEMAEWIHQRELPACLVLTKCDKVSKNLLVKHTKILQKAFAWESLPTVHYSTTQNLGRPQLIAHFQTLLNS